MNEIVVLTNEDREFLGKVSKLMEDKNEPYMAGRFSWTFRTSAK